MNTIVLVVDVQNALVHKSPYNCRIFLENLQALIAMARNEHLPVCYVQHDGGKGDELEKGSMGWAVYKDIAPLPGDKTIDKKRNSAFKDTGLHDYLQLHRVQKIVLAGMQTEYCIDATCKSAFDLGYTVVIPKGCTTTFDNEYFSGEKLSNYFENKIWNGRFADVVELSDFRLVE